MEITKILNINYAAATKWSSRNKTCGHSKQLRKKLERFLTRISGNDLNAMFHDIFKSQDFNPKYKESLRKMSQAINNKTIVKPKHKHHFIRPLREAGLTKKEVNSLGIQCSDGLWKNCLDQTERNLGGKSRFPEDLVNEINEHLNELSEPAKNDCEKV
jgi:hypothetical protein